MVSRFLTFSDLYNAKTLSSIIFKYYLNNEFECLNMVSKHEKAIAFECFDTVEHAERIVEMPS